MLPLWNVQKQVLVSMSHNQKVELILHGSCLTRERCKSHGSTHVTPWGLPLARLFWGRTVTASKFIKEASCKFKRAFLSWIVSFLYFSSIRFWCIRPCYKVVPSSCYNAFTSWVITKCLLGSDMLSLFSCRATKLLKCMFCLIFAFSN